MREPERQAPAEVPLERSGQAEARRERGLRLHAWGLPLLVVAFSSLVFLGRGRPLVVISPVTAIALGCGLWGVTLTPVIRYRSRVGALVCGALALVAIPACLIDFHPNAEGLHGLVRAFPAGACLSAMAIGFMARKGKL